MLKNRSDNTQDLQDRDSSGGTEMELIYLLEKRELLIRYEEGILPEQEDLSGITKIIDIGCGPGQWALEAANLLPDIEIFGVDPDQYAINYASLYARSMHIENVNFIAMDITKSLKFPDNMFDVVNAQYLQRTLTIDIWPDFIQECVRIVRPGGFIRFTEGVCIESNNEDFNQLTTLFSLALYKNGQSFSLKGNTLGITPMFGPLLRQVGCQHIRYKSFVIDINTFDLMQHVRIAYSLLKRFIINTGIISSEEYQQIYDRAMQAMFTPKFSALYYLLTSICEKPQ